MASRTKSFFEQNHSSKKPAQWNHRSKPVLKEAPVNIPTSRPSIPATSQTKSKLKAFQSATYEAGKPTLHKADKENHSAKREKEVQGSEDNGSTQGDDGALEDAAPASTPKPPSLPHANTFPSTPSGRLSLEDLIGNGEDKSNSTAVLVESPQEQLGWNPHSSAYTPHRKRKRARSSSPAYPNSSSQPLEKSTFFEGVLGVYDGNTTPEADPVTALWQAYGGKHAEGTLAIPEFNHLIAQASPRLMETPIKSGGLRRWASAGNDWPSSKTKSKRRCLNSATVNLWRDQTNAESGSRSRVASMVQKIQETLATQKLEQGQTETRSTSPDDTSSTDTLSDSPPENPVILRPPSPPKPRHARVSVVAKTIGSRSEADVPKPKPTSLHAPRERSKDVEPSPQQDPMISAPLHLHTKARLPAYKRPSITRVPSQPRIPKQQSKPVVHNTEFDEFDDAFDLTADDLDELLSQAPVKPSSFHDGPPHTRHALQNNGLAGPGKAASTSLAAPANLDDDDDDEFGCDDIDEESFAQAEFSATQALRISPCKNNSNEFSTSVKSTSSKLDRHPPLSRYTIKQIVDGEFTNVRGGRSPERLLMVEDSRTNRTVAITLRGSWLETSISRSDVIHVTYLSRSPSHTRMPSSYPGQVLINDDEESPLLITHPDHMLSATTVADSFDCVRKAVLQDRIKATGDTNKAMVYGKILHEIFQQALSMNKWDTQSLSQLTEAVVQNHLEGLWELGMTDTNLAIEDIRAKMGELAAWASVFVMSEPSEAALVDDQQGDKVRMSISKLIAVEEHVWSPQYGLKGNIDATIESTVIQSSSKLSRLVVPFEVKTGRTTQSAAHRAQTALYTILLSDRYNVAITAGILYYLESSSMSRVAPPVNEIRQMIQQRNRVAAYIDSARHPSTEKHQFDRVQQSQEIETLGLPSLLKNPFKCGRCYANQSCFTYHALQENGTAETAGMVDDNRKDHSLTWKEAVGHLHLSAKDPIRADVLRKWFSKWDRLLTFEEGEQSKVRKELWTMSSEVRESIGRCFGKLSLTRDLTSTEHSTPLSILDGAEGSGGKINRFTYVFARATAFPGKAFTEGSQLSVGEPVVVSSERGQWALANGYVVAVTKQEITVAVDRKLGSARQRLNDFNNENNQTFAGIMATDGSLQDSSRSMQQNELYRLDKDEFSNGLALVRNNLVALMSTHPFHTRLREQIVFGTEPSFSSSPTTIKLMPSQLGDMNADQQHAVQKVMSAKDYALILGMPGTGKTTTIAHIIRALLADGQSILLTSFTHTAVDNILLKIRDIAPQGSILRLGNSAKINSQVQSFCQLAATPRKTLSEIEQSYTRTQIVATTCMGTNHPLFNRRSFDICIVDEASQITLPTILGPLLHARKFILVGDHYQLPPLVQNRAALEGGLDVSLFRQLSEQVPQAVAKLGLQYRMCADIMSLSNQLIYSGQLRCGNPSVAERKLSLPLAASVLPTLHSPSCCRDPPSSSSVSSSSAPPASASSPPPPCWLSQTLSPSLPVVFINTDPLGPSSLETITSSGKSIVNHLEAKLTSQLVSSFISLGVSPSEIGVITLYRSQLALLRECFVSAGIPGTVEIDSADRFQGRDKECVVLSMVRANDKGIVGELLKDWRRVNVAITRARSKLVVVGSWRTLKGNELLREMVGTVKENGWGVELPRGYEPPGKGDGYSGKWDRYSGKGDGKVGGKKGDGDKDRSEVGTAIGSGGLKERWDGGNSGGKRQERKKRKAEDEGNLPRRVEGRKGDYGGKKVREVRERVKEEIMEDWDWDWENERPMEIL